MAELSCYQVLDNGDWQRFGSNERFNRVLYGGHGKDVEPGRFFTFAGDVPLFMGAMSDYRKNSWCYQAKLGILQSGLALTPGVTQLSNDLGSHDNFSRFFHDATDIVSTWKHGAMHYDFTRNSPWFPETKTHVEIYPLQDDDGYVVHYNLIADGEIIFVALLGGITDFIGRFDSPESAKRQISESDFADTAAEVCGDHGRITEKSGGKYLLAGNDFGAEVSADASGAALELYPSLSLLPHDGDKTVLKFVRRLAPGERLCGNIVVLANGDEAALKRYLAADPRPQIIRQIAAKSAGIGFSTPDLRLNGVVKDLQIALDASYHAPGFFHGAVGYHAPFLGWRNYYAPSLAGQFDRVRGAIKAHIATQLHDAEAEKVWYDGADRPDLDHEGTQYHHLAHPQGKLTALLHADDIYNMQEVATDMIFYYLERSADFQLGAEIFDALGEMLDFEERIFDPDGDGLYQNFLNTWISDGHSYNGGGCAQATFYNYAANVEMARLGRRLGRDTTRFSARAERIRQAIQSRLYLPKAGVFAEYIDTVGKKLTHPSPELSTIYLSAECDAATAEQLVKNLEFTENHIRNVITANRHGRLAYSANWLPKKYSTCGIFPAENAALALAYFRAFRGVEARRLIDGLLDAFALSHSPGAIAHVLTASGSNDDGDWDFSDATGTILRVLVEGLWGVRFRKLSNELELAPQLPPQWHEAQLRLPDLSLFCRRDGESQIWQIAVKGVEKVRLYLPGAAQNITVNGQVAESAEVDFSGVAVRELTLSGASDFEVVFVGEFAEVAPAQLLTGIPEPKIPVGRPAGKWKNLDCQSIFNVELAKLFDREYRAPRPDGYSIGMRRNGRYAWEWNHFGHNAVHLDDAPLRQAPGGIYQLKSGWSFPTPAVGNNAAVVSIWENFPTELELPLSGSGEELALFIFGATNAMQSGVVNAQIAVNYAEGKPEVVKLLHPQNFDDLLVPALQMKWESFYWSEGNHGMIVRIKLDPKRKLASLKLTSLANEVLLGLLGAAIR